MIFVFSFSALADEGVYILAGLGSGKSTIKPEYQIYKESEENKTLDVQLVFGYHINPNFLIESGFLNHGSLDIFGYGEHTDVTETVVMTGYVIHLGNHFAIAPRIGYSWWHLESTEGMFFNPGPEAVKSFRGNEFSYMVVTSFDMLNISYQNVNYKFGSLKSLIVGLKIEL